MSANIRHLTHDRTGLMSVPRYRNSWFVGTMVGVSHANLAAMYVPIATDTALFFQ